MAESFEWKWYKCTSDPMNPCELQTFSGTEAEYWAFISAKPGVRWSERADCIANCQVKRSDWYYYVCNGKLVETKSIYASWAEWEHFLYTHPNAYEKKDVAERTCAGGDDATYYYYECQSQVCRLKAYHGPRTSFDTFVSGNAHAYYKLIQCESACVPPKTTVYYYVCENNACARRSKAFTDASNIPGFFGKEGIYKTLEDCQAVCRADPEGESFPYYTKASGACEADTFLGTLEEFQTFLTGPDVFSTKLGCTLALERGDDWYDGGAKQGWWPFKFLQMFFGNFFNRS